jgi:hypothetical protein
MNAGTPIMAAKDLGGGRHVPRGTRPPGPSPPWFRVSAAIPAAQDDRETRGLKPRPTFLYFTTHRPRPWRLASYRASSARRLRLSGVSSPFAAAMPKDALKWRVVSLKRNGVRASRA